ncbi:mannose-1-phosphate guanylyltransferase [Desulfatiglans anilini]|uniref:mannose-1-phosphate guanylyltransferase n=1 Tax=Desulfatiglans anilini TaxID=90728 RepID=UPI00042A10BC|nr:sugar phosphate nucleotidyltransferase [Desulfatiglans anilini]
MEKNAIECAVVMAGGSGTRFWPMSRALKPKQFLPVTGGEPLLVETCNRLSPILGDERIVAVLGESHLSEAKACLGGRPIHLIGEPVGRNTAPCIALGAFYARWRGIRGAIAFLPADHHIGDRQSFLDALCVAGRKSLSGGIVTLGIVPDQPETGYGYIRREGSALTGPAEWVYRVAEFVEKPALADAKSYVASGEYYWNAGVFVATAETLLMEVERHLPALYKALSRLEGAFGREGFAERLGEVYATIEGISFDYGVMEKPEVEAYVVPCRCDWSDVGSWASLYALWSVSHDAKGNLADAGAVLIDCRGSFVQTSGKKIVACLGLEDVLVVDTPDALLVTRLDRSQDIRKIVEALKAAGKDGYL